MRVAFARGGPLAVAAVAAWLTAGVVSPTGANPTLRLGVLPPPWMAAVLLLAVIAIAPAIPLPSARLRPLYLTALLWLPWLPAPIPAAFLLWQGPLAWAVWAAVAGLLIAPVARTGWSRLLAAPARAQFRAAVLVAAVVYAAAAWRMAPVLPGGDEPHYLVITQSLLYDHDLKIENNHRRGDYRAYIEQDLKPDYLRRGADHEIYSVHAPGVSALVLPAFAVAGYRGVIGFLVVFSALGAALAWWAAWRLTRDAAAAWAGWAAVALTAPFLFQAFTVYPDGPGAVLVMTGTYALACSDRLAASRWRALAHGAALAALPWLHTRYAILAGVLGVLIVARLVWPSSRPGSPAPDPAARPGAWPLPLTPRALTCAAFLAVPLASAASWFWSFHAIYGTFNPAAPYGSYTQSALGNAPRGLAGLLVDQQFGLLPNAPVYLVALGGTRALWRCDRRLAIELLLVAVPYAVAVACYHMWWGGHSSPARFIVAVLLPCALPMATWWARATTRTRGTGAVLLAVSVGLAVTLAWVGRGALVYNFRDGFALWMDWAAPLVNLPRALPTSFRNSRPVSAWLVAAWAFAAAIAWAASRLLSRPAAEGPHSAMRAWTALALATMVGATLGWRVAGAAPLETGTGLLRVARAAADRGEALTLPFPRRADAARALAHVRVPSALRRDAPADGLLFGVRDLPAGRYRVIADGSASLSGMLEATVGRRVAPWVRERLGQQPPGATPMLLDLPAGAQVLTITGDEAARRSITAVQLEIESFDAHTDVEFARRVTRYRDTTVWFVDDGAFAEPEGLWVRGRASTVLVLDAAPRSPSGPLLVRNGGVANRVTLEAGVWTVTMNLTPGEERPVDVPLTQSRTRLRVSSEAGFRPSEVDPASRDTRLLGVWVQVR